MENKNQGQLQPQKKQEVALKTFSEVVPFEAKSGNDGMMAMYEHKLSLTTALKSQPLRNVVRTNKDRTEAITMITYVINRAAKAHAVYKEIESGLDVSLALDVLELMEYDSFEDIVLMFKMARQGKLVLNKYSKRKSFYETVLQDYIPAYLDLKAEARQKLKKAEAEERKRLERESEGSPEYLEFIRNLRKSIEEQGEAKNRSYGKTSPISDPSHPMNNSDALSEHISGVIKKWPTDKIQEQIPKWESDRKMKPYVELLFNELKLR